MNVLGVTAEGEDIVITIEIRKTFAELMQDEQLRETVARKKPAKTREKWPFHSQITGKSYKTEIAMHKANAKAKNTERDEDHPAYESPEDKEKAYVAVKRITKLQKKLHKLEELQGSQIPSQPQRK